MSYTFLTEEDVRKYQESRLTEDMIRSLDLKEKDKLDEKVHALRINRELRLVVCGKTGAGKSSLGNLMTGKSTFKESYGASGCTKTICKESCEVDGIDVHVIDTPGLFDPDEEVETTLCEMAKVTDRFSDGIHGFLFVFNAGNPRFTEEERNAFDVIMKKSLGPEFLKHCFLIITHGYDMLQHTTLKEFLESEKDSPFGSLLTEIGRTKVIAADNSEKTEYGRREQQQQIVRMIAANVEGVYTSEAHITFQEERRKTAEKLNTDVRYLAPAIEEALSDELDRRAWHDIIAMNGAMKDVIVESVFVKVRGKADPSVSDEKLRETIHIILKDKIWRFSAKAMLGGVAAGSALVGIGAAILATGGPAVVLGAIIEALPEAAAGLAGILALFSKTRHGKGFL